MGLRRWSVGINKRLLRHRPLRLEPLELRLAPAGLFVEDFSSDVDLAVPGFDTAADGFAITNSLPPPRSFSEGTPLPGSGGVYYVQPGNPGDPGWGLYADGHVLAIVSSNVIVPSVAFTIPAPGTPGGPPAGEEAVGIGVSVQGFGLVQIHGEFGTKVVNINSGSTWQRVFGERDEILPSGFELGAIRQLTVFSYEYIVLDIVSVQIAADVVDQPPVASDDLVIVDRRLGPSEIFDPLANDFDPEFGPIEFANIAFVGPTRGTLTRVEDQFGNYRGFVYSPSDEALADPTFREDSFTYTIRDALNQWASATVRLVVNTPPLAVLDDFELPHGFTGPFAADFFGGRGILDNDFDPDDDALTITDFSQPQHGTVTVTPEGRVTYSPTTPGGLVYPDAFTYAISDGYFTAHGQVLIHVPNAAPIAQDDFLVVEHGDDEIETLDVTANDPGDPDGDAVRPIVVDQPQQGTLHVFSDGRMRYVSSSYQVRTDSFTYRLHDPYAAVGGRSNLATVRILVPNRVPTAIDDEYEVWPDTPLTVLSEDGVLRNDGDLDGDFLIRATLTKQPGYGSVTLNDDGTFTYVPDGYFQGTDSFGYTVSDGIGESHQATVTLKITTGAPLARNDVFVIEPDSQPVELDLLENDWDPEGRLLSIAIPAESFPSHGSIVSGPNGTILYQPNPGYEGSDEFQYRVINGVEGSALATVFLQITDSPDVPVANFDHYSLLHDAPRTVPSSIGLLHNDSLLPGPTTFVTLVRPPRLGTLNTLSLNDAGAFTYTPDPGFIGFDSFSYRITNNIYESEAQTVSIQVRNETPIAQDDFFPVALDSYVWANVLANDFDPDADDNDNLTVELVSGPASNARFVLEPDGDLYFEPLPGLIGMDRITYRVFDGAGYSEVAEVAIGGFHANVAYLSTPSRETVVVRSTPGTLLEASVTGTPPQVTPPGVEFPLGFFSFTVRDLPADGQATVRITLPFDGPEVNEYWKYGQEEGNPHDHWYEFDRVGDTGAEFLTDEIVLHFVDGGRGDATGIDGMIVDPGGPALAQLPPQVEGVTINDGAAQRSKVNSVTVTFSELVSIDPGALEIRQIGARHPVKLRVELSETAGQTVARLSFKGAGVVGGSLADGQYVLTILADKVRNEAGDLLDGDGDGLSGGDRLDVFFRRFGDADGDGDVDAADRDVFQAAFGKRSGQAGYQWYLDFNANRRVWAEDAAMFWKAYYRSRKGL